MTYCILLQLIYKLAMNKNMFASLVLKVTEEEEEDNVNVLTKKHQSKAIEFYNDFQEGFIQNLNTDLKEIQNALNVEMGRTIRKLENKMRGSYAASLAKTVNTFYLEPFVDKEVKQVYKSVAKLKEKIFMYINDFCDNILSQNLERSKQICLYHYSNEIRALDETWKSVTSRCSMNKAEVFVKGFHRPQTTWLALGVSKKMKEYGPVKNGMQKQNFMGNIYLNGSQDLHGGFNLKKDLNEGDVFVIECMNRMVWVYRKKDGKNKKQPFIMEDNVEYYMYLAIKGPIELTFRGNQ